MDRIGLQTSPNLNHLLKKKNDQLVTAVFSAAAAAAAAFLMYRGQSQGIDIVLLYG